jgi:hypothetical protein
VQPASPSVFRIHLADPGDRETVIEVPTETLEPTERGIVIDGALVFPWHRVIRYARETTQELEHSLRQHAEVRVWLDDGTDVGETLTVRADRFEVGPYTVDMVIEHALNVEAGLFHVTKIYVPWDRVLEFERLPMPSPTADVPIRPD